MATRFVRGILVLLLGAAVASPAVHAAQRPQLAQAGRSHQQADATPAVDTAVAPAPTPTSPPPATGTITALATYGLAFGRSPAVVPVGTLGSGVNGPGVWVVATVDVAFGDRVRKGDVLATAETTLAQLQVDSAQASVDLAQARMGKDIAKPTADDILRAQAVVDQAQQRVAAATQSLADTEAQSAAVIRGARQQVRLAASIFRVDRNAGQPGPVLVADQRALVAAQVVLRNAIATAAGNDHRAAQAVDAARLALDAATQAYEVAVAPAPADVIAADRAAVAQAKVALANARTILDGARIVAPVDGIVSAIALVAGAVASPGDGIQIQQGPPQAVLQVPQADILTFASGQEVSVTVVASGQRLLGVVVRIGLTPSSAAGAPAVTYPVTLTLRDAPDALRPGMTVTLDR